MFEGLKNRLKGKPVGEKDKSNEHKSTEEGGNRAMFDKHKRFHKLLESKGIDFRKEYTIDSYRADCYLPDKNLVIEVDSGKNVKELTIKLGYIKKKGYKVAFVDDLSPMDKQLEEILKEKSSCQEFLEEQIVSPSFLIEPLLSEQGIMLITGPPKAGKTIFATNLVDHLATGTDLQSLKIPKPVRVGVVQRELHVAFFRDWIDKILRTNATGNVEIHRGNLSLPGDLKELVKWIVNKRLDVVILDPLYMVFEGHINLDKDVTDLFRPLKQITENLNVSFIICHHLTKSEDSARGSGLLGAVCDSQIILKGEQLSFDFVRYGQKPEPLGLKLDERTLKYSLGTLELEELILEFVGDDEKPLADVEKYVECEIGKSPKTVQRVLNGSTKLIRKENPSDGRKKLICRKQDKIEHTGESGIVLYCLTTRLSA